MTPILRAAQHNDVMVAIGAPKPPPRLHRTKAGKYAPEKRPNEKRDQEQELEAFLRKFIWWRDGGKCICAVTDGENCGGQLQWGHFLDRAQSGWFTLTLVSFIQCSNHNKLNIDDKSIMRKALRFQLGEGWLRHIEIERMVHKSNKVYPPDLTERMERYQRLWDNRPSLYTKKMLVAKGFYD